MKKKHHGLLSAILIFLAIGVMSLYAVNRTWRTQAGIQRPHVKPLPKVFVPGTAEIKMAEQLNRRMDVLSFPHQTDRVPVNLALFGYFAPSESDRSGAAKDVAGLDKKSYLLTFAFASDAKQFCIINGSFYQTGSLLPDESTIFKIESRRVLVAKEGVKRWIYLAEEDLPNGRRRPDAGKKGRHQEGG
jgi:hypothetical protein